MDVERLLWLLRKKWWMAMDVDGYHEFEYGYHEVILGNLHAELPLPCQKVIFLLVTMVTKFSNHWLLNLVTRVTKFRNLHAERW